jgi:hypothetical protein
MPLFLSLGSRMFIADPEEDTTDFRISTRWSVVGNEGKPGKPETLSENPALLSGENMISGIPATMPGEMVTAGTPVTLTTEVEFFKSA